MTAIVGILCKDGVVIGADCSATFGPTGRPTIEQPTRKIEIINNQFILAGTGEVGLGQRFTHEVNAVISMGDFKSLAPIELCRKISEKAVKNFVSTGVKTHRYGALFAFPGKSNSINLCEYDIEMVAPELKNSNLWYASMGSGQAITDPFLAFIRKIFWSKGMPTLNHGIFATIWSIQHAIEINPGGIKGPIDVAVLENSKGKISARLLDEAEIQEHIDNLKTLEEYISAWQTMSASSEELQKP